MKNFKEHLNESKKQIKYPDGVIPNGTEKYFEYHCFESDESCDAKLWYHSHQKCIVIKDETEENVAPTFEGRCEQGIFRCYKVRFSDGFEYTAMEDELMDSPKFFHRPDPPKKGIKK